MIFSSQETNSAISNKEENQP